LREKGERKKKHTVVRMLTKATAQQLSPAGNFFGVKKCILRSMGGVVGERRKGEPS
jgi:hypothetical protein